MTTNYQTDTSFETVCQEIDSPSGNDIFSSKETRNNPSSVSQNERKYKSFRVATRTTGTHIPNQVAFVEALKSRNVNTFRELYDNYSEALYGRVLKMTSDSNIAQDILQNAFLKIWINIEMFDLKQGSLFTWMVTICRNEVIDYYKFQQSAKRKVTNDYIRWIDSEEKNPAVDKIDLHYFLSSLKPADRAIFDLIYLQGFTYVQASELLKVPTGTLKTRVRTILQGWRAAAAKGK